MGIRNALEMHAAHLDGLIDLRSTIVWHLSSNLYPAVPEWMADGAIRAIEFVQKGEENHPVVMVHPENGVAKLQIKGQLWTATPARLLIEVLHLEAFIKPAEEV